jgi:hypothetical protein
MCSLHDACDRFKLSSNAAKGDLLHEIRQTLFAENNYTYSKGDSLDTLLCNMRDFTKPEGSVPLTFIDYSKRDVTSTAALHCVFKAQIENIISEGYAPLTLIGHIKKKNEQKRIEKAKQKKEQDEKKLQKGEKIVEKKPKDPRAIPRSGQVEDYTTISELCFYDWKQLLNDDSLELPVAYDYLVDKEFKLGCFAGRSSGCAKAANLEAVGQYDIVSQYPWSQIAEGNMFPIAGPVEYVKQPSRTRCGIYKIRIIAQPNVRVIPRRSENGYDYDYAGAFNTVGLLPHIIALEISGATFEVIEGLEWTNSSDKIFKRYILPLFKMKSMQDVLSAASEIKDYDERVKMVAEAFPDEPRNWIEQNVRRGYNQAMREIVKLMLVAISGKCLQRTFTSNIEYYYEAKKLTYEMINAFKSKHQLEAELEAAESAICEERLQYQETCVELERLREKRRIGEHHTPDESALVKKLETVIASSKINKRELGLRKLRQRVISAPSADLTTIEFIGNKAC